MILFSLKGVLFSRKSGRKIILEEIREEQQQDKVNILLEKSSHENVLEGYKPMTSYRSTL